MCTHTNISHFFKGKTYFKNCILLVGFQCLSTFIPKSKKVL